MDFLKAEIERKKRQIQEKNVLQPQKKYFKRGDLLAVQEAEYLDKYGISKKGEADTAPKAEEPVKEAEVEATEEDLTSPNLYPLPKEEVIRRLREINQAIRLFGESDEGANRRLRSLVLDEDDNFRLHKSTNDYQEAMKLVDKQYLKIIEASDPIDHKEKLELKLYTTKLTYSELQTLAMDIRRGNANHDDNVIAEWIKLMMTLWGKELNERGEDDKMTLRGKMDSGTFTQTKMYIKPLLKLLKKNTMSDDIRDSLSSMVKYIMHKDYILANEKYMEMAIGNAPWPIGVTNAGIHARPGRERIFSKHVAHVLNDESQRRWIQGLKRLVTKSQQYFPTDPSRMVEYIKADIKPQVQEEVEQGAEEIPKGPELNRRTEEELIDAAERHDPANRWGGKKIFNRQ